MITIRYADLPEGLHAQAERQGRRTVIYLRPGLTAEQRRRGLRRARQSARMGYGPRLPALGVAQAVARDVIRETAGNLGAALRRHPLGSMLMAAAFGTMISCYALFVTGSIRLVLHTSPVPAPAGRPQIPAFAPQYASPAAGRAGASGPASLPGYAHRPASARLRAAERSPDRDHGRPGPAPSSTASGTPAPTRSATPSPAPSPKPSAFCVNVGPLGVCLP
jgi:hypothetical protein